MKNLQQQIEAQRKLVNSIDFASDRERFEAEFAKLSVMREMQSAANPVRVGSSWCTTDGEWWV